MHERYFASRAAALLFAAGLLCAPAYPAQTDQAANALARDIFRELVEINTTESAGNVTAAAEAMARRLRAAGFAEQDIQVLGPNERKKNLVVRLRGTGQHQPVLLIGHLDVVEARRKDWSTDPFKFVERNGRFYGRGTQDMKDGDAIMMATLIRLHAAGFRPARDIILALTADEEAGDSNGVGWLLQNHRELIDAQFVINHDGNSINADHGRPLYFEMDGTEKVYADFVLSTRDPGGHSSLPVPENAIYELAAALERLAKYDFPFELNNVTRGYYQRMASIETGERAADMRAILQTPPDPRAIERLSHDPFDHSIMRTTCVATRIEGGHANNALPHRARATVNCRILPGHSPEEVRHTLIEVLADPRVEVQYTNVRGELLDTAPEHRGFAPPPLDPQVMRPLEAVVAQMWPGLQVIPAMSAGASDAVHTSAAGLPTYLIAGVSIDKDNQRAHGQDENIEIDSFERGNEFFYRYVQALTAK